MNAENISDDKARERLMEIARLYERLAEIVAKRPSKI
jgi:hypothetical protein